MIELVPWMLILVWWHPEEPGVFEIAREHHLFASKDACLTAGENRVAGVDMYDLEHSGAKVSYTCMTVPDSAEYDVLFAEFHEHNRQDTAKMQMNPDSATGEGQ